MLRNPACPTPYRNGGHEVAERWTRHVGMLDTPTDVTRPACPPFPHLVSTIPAPRVHHSRTSCQPFPHLMPTIPVAQLSSTQLNCSSATGGSGTDSSRIC